MCSRLHLLWVDGCVQRFLGSFRHLPGQRQLCSDFDFVCKGQAGGSKGVVLQGENWVRVQHVSDVCKVLAPTTLSCWGRAQ